jgi:hypothetical protein
VHASSTAFRRFVRRYVDERPRRAVVRLEVGPGEEAQVDFGFAGLVPRAPGEASAKTWVFVMTLSHSRHQCVELVPGPDRRDLARAAPQRVPVLRRRPEEGRLRLRGDERQLLLPVVLPHETLSLGM